MLAEIRRERIKKIILEKGSITIAELTQQFQVSTETIRRDIKTLHSEGILKKIYGGAVLRTRVNPPIEHEILEDIFIQSKKLIGEICKDFIQNNDSIFLDHSTTALQISYLIQDMNLTVLTNSLSILNILGKSKGIDLVSLGGNYNSSEGGFFGRIAINEFVNFHVDKSFVSCTSLTIDRGINDKTEEISELRRIAIKNSNEVYLVVDHTKFGKNAFINTADYSNIDYVITDFLPSPEWITFFKKHQILLRYPKTPEKINQIR